MPEPVFTVANQLTMLRMALVPLFVIVVLSGEFAWALVVFVTPGLTDALDGFVARRTQVTRLGMMLDPMADKLLAASAYSLLTLGTMVRCAVPVWLTVTLLFRDGMLVVAVAIVHLTVGPRSFPPSRLGKGSTALLLLTATGVLAANATGDCWFHSYYLQRIHISNQSRWYVMSGLGRISVFSSRKRQPTQFNFKAWPLVLITRGW